VSSFSVGGLFVSVEKNETGFFWVIDFVSRIFNTSLFHFFRLCSRAFFIFCGNEQSHFFRDEGAHDNERMKEPSHFCPASDLGASGAIDRVPERLQMAKDGGAEVLNYEQVEVGEALKEITGGARSGFGNGCCGNGSSRSGFGRLLR
jgi:hypothetical protein